MQHFCLGLGFYTWQKGDNDMCYKDFKKNGSPVTLCFEFLIMYSQQLLIQLGVTVCGLLICHD